MRVARVLFALVLLLGVVGACGDDADDPPTEDVDGQVQAPDQEEEADASESCVRGEPTTSESGLVIEDLECGTGEEARRGNYILVHYQGELEDGTVIDSSRGGAPLPLNLGGGGVIQGWEEGIPGMRVGGVRKLTIPPELAYGSSGAGPIPPNSTLIFEVELLEIQTLPAN